MRGYGMREDGDPIPEPQITTAVVDPAVTAERYEAFKKPEEL